METTKDQSQHATAEGNGAVHGTTARPGAATEAFADGVKPHPHHEELHAHVDMPTDLPKVRTWGVALAGMVVVAAMGGLFVLGWVPRQHRLADLHEQTAGGAGGVDDRPNVEVTRPKRSASAVDLVLPADARANQETAIFARANGYLKRFTVDIGDQVKAGQLLAEIDAPDVDAELVQAKASVGQAKANVVKAQDDLELARTTFERYKGFGKTGGVSQQEIDEKRAAVAQAQSALEAFKASVAAAEATVQRLAALQGFEKVYAPFAGTVTARNMDVGALVSAGQTMPLFRIADTDVLRVYVNVPQSYVQSVQPGQKVALTVRNYPGREFEGVVARTTGALDPATRTLRYEVDVPNKDGVLLAGMYGEVRIKAKQDEPPMVVPTSAVVFDAGGTKVWVVEDGKVYQKRVDVGRDFGTEIEVSNGLSGKEQVVTNPGERLADGVEVEAKLPPQQQASAR
jgi:RND family efflux transporter MFP subunit